MHKGNEQGSNRSIHSNGLGINSPTNSLPEVETNQPPVPPRYDSPSMSLALPDTAPAVQFIGVNPKDEDTDFRNGVTEMHPLTSIQPAEPDDGATDPNIGQEPFLFSRMDRSGGTSASHIFQYAREGNMVALKNALGPPGVKTTLKRVNAKDEDKLTALHYAARYNHLDCCKLLVERGATVDIEGDEKATPLHVAARYRRVRAGATGKTEQNSSFASISNVDTTISVPKSKSMPSMGPQTRLQAEESNPTIDNSVILYLVSGGADINKQDFYGCTPLHYASMRGNEVAAEHLLLCRGLEIDKTDNEQMTPLHLACSHGQTEIAKMLIKANADINAKEESESTPLHLACAEGNMEIIKMIFDKAVENHRWQNVRALLDKTDNELNTPLHTAVENNNIEAAKLCIEKGADVDAVNSAMESPLHLAARVGNLELCQLLIEKNARLDALDSQKQTALHKSVQHDNANCVKFFLEKGARIEFRDCEGFTPLLLAADQGCVNTTKLLLEHGADINAIEMDERSAVFLAAEQNNVGVLEMLTLDPRCDELQLINATDRENNTPLHVASSKGYGKIVRLLLSLDVDLDAKNEDEQTAMHLAAASGRTKIVKLLLEKDKNLANDEDEDSNTPLHLAAIAGHAKVVTCLLEGGADIDARNSVAWTALDCAGAKGNVKVAKVLLENDSPVDPQDKSKVTPLYLACKYGHTEMVMLLMEWGADVSQSVVVMAPPVDEAAKHEKGVKPDFDPLNGSNCLDAAIDNQHKEVAKIILESPRWEDALRNVTVNPRTGERDTPMRKLIRKMPDIATLVFKRCALFNEYHQEHEKFKITFNYEFLDDMYAQWGTKIEDKGDDEDKPDKSSDAASMTEGGRSWTTADIYAEDGHLRDGVPPYTNETSVLKFNHPLMIMVKSKREDLLDHPLVENLLRHKWNAFGRVVYYVNLSIYVIFLVFFNIYMITTKPTYHYYENITTSRTWKECDDIRKLLPPANQNSQPLPSLISMYFVMALAALALLKEIFQMLTQKWNYLNFENAMEWAIYTLAFVSVLNFDPCQNATGIRYWWQWNTGSMAIFLAWLNLVLFIRKVPRFGIYVVMFTDVLETFLRFLFVFILFVLSFAVTFYLLMQNQTAFNSLPKATLKTFVMMIGEFEYDAHFDTQHDDKKTHKNQIYYDEVTYLVFTVFLIVMSILIMNLLVGLAVDNITAVQKLAVLKRLAMQVELVLEVENMLPNFLKRRFVIRGEAIKPNVKRNWIHKFFTNTEDQKHIVEQLDPQLNEFRQVMSSQDLLASQVSALKSRVKTMRVQNERMECMLTAIISHLQIAFEEEDEHHDEADDDKTNVAELL